MGIYGCTEVAYVVAVLTVLLPLYIWCEGGPGEEGAKRKFAFLADKKRVQGVK